MTPSTKRCKRGKRPAGNIRSCRRSDLPLVSEPLVSDMRGLLAQSGTEPLWPDLAIQYALKKANCCRNQGGSDEGSHRRRQPRTPSWAHSVPLINHGKLVAICPFYSGLPAREGDQGARRAGAACQARRRALADDRRCVREILPRGRRHGACAGEGRQYPAAIATQVATQSALKSEAARDQRRK